MTTVGHNRNAAIASMQNECAPPPASECIVEQTAFTWYMRLRVPKLFKLVVRGCWEQVPKRAASHPQEAKFVLRYAPNDTALHRVVRVPVDSASGVDVQLYQEITKLRLTAIRALLEANPDAVSTPDHFDKTPLHLACENAFYAEGAAELMLSVCPQAARARDWQGQTPLHSLLSQAGSSGTRVELVRLLAAAYPQGLVLRDGNSKTPLDLAKAAGNDEGTVAALACTVPTIESTSKYMNEHD